MKDGKYNVWNKKTREWLGATSPDYFLKDYLELPEYIAELIEEHEYPKCPEADGWFIVQGSNRVPIVRRRIAGNWCCTAGRLLHVTPDCYTILREIDPL